MKEIENTYFKLLHNEQLTLLSGRHLPDPKGGPYRFIGCSFHPRVASALMQLYRDSKFERCDGVMFPE